MGVATDSVATRDTNRIELRVVQTFTATPDAWITVSNEAHVINFPVQTQLGVPIRAVVGHDTVTLREGKLFIHDAGRATARITKKPSYGLVRYHTGVDVEMEAREQFHARLYVPSERYREIWDLAARGRLPRLISLQVKGLEDDGEWHVDETGNMLLIEEFSFSFPIGP